MRNMSFALTTDQVRARTKTVTRRLGWRNLAPGTLLQPIVKGQGLKKGEHPASIGGPIRVITVRQERLDRITWTECTLEGFPTLGPDDFVAIFTKHNGCLPDALVTRIAFEYLED